MGDRDFYAMVGDAIRVTADELRPWMKARLDVWPTGPYGKVNPNDPSYLVNVMLDNWRPTFASDLGGEGLTVVQEFRHTRNRWAHYTEFDRLSAFRAIDTCRLLLVGIGSNRRSDLAKVLEGLFETPPAPTSPMEPATPKPSPVGAPRSVSRPSSRRRHRRASDPAFRAEQWEHLHDPHVAPLNLLVDDLIAERPGSYMPYISPLYGGVEATILLLFQDPGRMTDGRAGGSGFLSPENDDPSAGLLADCIDEAGLVQSDLVSWNAFPWFLEDQGNVTTRMLQEGVDPLCRFIALLPRLTTVVTCGNKAHQSWGLLEESAPGVAGRLVHLETFHTRGRGITNGGRQTKAVGAAHFVDTLRAAAGT